MRTVIVRDAMRIPLGKQGENNAVRVVWPGIIESYAKLYGGGDFSLVVLRPGDSAPYPAVVAEEGADLVWTVGSADTAKDGYGSAELIYTVGGVVAKSQTWGTIVNNSLSGQEPGEPPEPQKSWVDNVIQTGAKAQKAQIRAEGAAEQSAKKAQEAAQSAAEAKESAKIAKQEADRALTLIDDTAIVRDKTWSSSNIVEIVCPAIEETGNPVVCTPVPNYPLGVKVSWTPIQECSGEPSPDNIRPIKGRDSVTVERKEDSLTHTLTLPSTIYGGEVDAVTGEGRERVKITVVDGTEVKFIDVNGYWNLPNYSSRGISAILLSSHFNKNVFAFNARYGFVFTTKKIMESMFQTVDELNAYCADQYAAGTPVQIAYQVAEPTPFAATGGPPIPVLNGTNTILTDADSVTVTGRETPQSYIDRKLKETNTAIAAL